MPSKSVKVSNWYTVSDWARYNQVPVSNWYTVSNWAVHFMQCFDYSKSRSVTQAHKIKKWSVSGIKLGSHTLPYPYAFWLAEHESKFRKPPSPSSFEQIAKKTPKPRKSSRTQFSFWKSIYYYFYEFWSPFIPTVSWMCKFQDISLLLHEIYLLRFSELLRTISLKLEDYESSSMLKSWSIGINI